ncbi:MAG TPA: GC-type dockerin domain-anchored protein, partial [Phycisphaerales bacterium]|nr:GC-type dockerin domain-anchored protein [Phycisphaerales bacterium]
ASLGGEYHGDGSNCSDVFECKTGQCCFEGGCAEATPWDCFNNNQGYVWSTPGDCNQPCLPLGACCTGDFCYQTVQVFCNPDNGEVWLGAGTQCDSACDHPQYAGACCFKGQGCADGLSEADCASQGGIWFGERSQCGDNDCDVDQPNIGACCLPNNTCIQTNPNTCKNLGGLFSGPGTSCATSCGNGGIPYVGACCWFDEKVDDYVCTLTDRIDCEDNYPFSKYFGDGSMCGDLDCWSDVPVLGACCLTKSGECHETTQSICESAGGTYQGDWTYCSETQCESTGIGACCTIDGSCQQSTQQECFDTLGGVNWQFGVTCEDAGCVAALGQCCIPGGQCANIGINDCFSNYPGAYWTYPSDCSNTCEPFGACCGIDGCRITVAGFCTGPGDVWKGANTTCADDDGVDGPDVCEPCPADIAPIGGDGTVNIDDLTAIILNWGGNDPNADITKNGVVNIDDLTAIILAWGPCPSAK